MHPLKNFKGVRHSRVEELEPCGAFVRHTHTEFCSLGKVWKGFLSGKALPGNGNSSESSPRLAEDPSSLPKRWNGLGLELVTSLFASIPNLREFLGLWEHWSSLGFWELGANEVLESPSLEMFKKRGDMALESLENTWGWDNAGLDLRDLSQP